MNYVPASGDYPFCNMLKWADPWWSMEDNNPCPPDKLNSDGYPISLVGTSGGVKVNIQTPTQLEKPGNWILRWTGTGCQLDLGMAGGFTTISGSGTSSPWVIKPSALGTTDVNLHVYNIGTGISNIELVHADDLSDLDAGNIFSKQFRDTLKAANFGCIRFLNWTAINTTMVAHWRYRMPLSYVSWGFNLLPPELYAGVTTNTSVAYAVTVPGTLKHSSDGTAWANGDAPKDKDTVIVRIGASLPFTVGTGCTISNASPGVVTYPNTFVANDAVVFTGGGANVLPSQIVSGTTYYVCAAGLSGTSFSVSAAPSGPAINTTGGSGTFNIEVFLTLKIGSGAAIAVLNPTITRMSIYGNDFPTINGIATFVYDADLTAWIKWGGNQYLWFGRGIETGVPPEVMLRLCAEIGAHPWINMAPYALDPMTDYATGLVDFVYANKQSWMIPRFEVANEQWNGQFVVYSYAQKKALAHWGSAFENEWYGKTTSTLGQYVASKFGVTKANVHSQNLYHVCCGVQTANGNTFNNASTSDPRLFSNAYVTQAAAAQSGYAKDRARDWTTHVAIANYFTPVFDRSEVGEELSPLAISLAASLAAVQFTVGSCSGGSLTISGYTVYGGETPSLPNGATIVIDGLGVNPGTTMIGTYPNYTVSDTALNLPAGWKLYAYPQANLTYLQDYVDTINYPAQFNASTVGTLMTVHSVSTPTTGIQKIQPGMMLLYSGGYAVTWIVTDGALSGTGGVGQYRLNTALPGGDITTTNVTGCWKYDLTFQRLYTTNWKQWALGHGVNRMCFYEGGWSPDYVPFGNSYRQQGCMKHLSRYISSTSRNPAGVATVTLQNYNDCTSISDGSFTSEFPSQYLITGPYPSLQIWNMLETIYRKPKGATFDAIATYNSGGATSIGAAVFTYSLKGQ
jgi:hypothetical protein